VTGPAPSAIARKVAATEWPDVQDQSKLTTGIFNFSCAGHGGVVAVIGVAKLDERYVHAARETGFIDRVAITPNRFQIDDQGSRTVKTWSITALETHFKEGQLEKWALGLNGYMQEVWIGEEDCAWATIALASEAMRIGLSKRMTDPDDWMKKYGTEDYARATCKQWHPEYLDALGETMPRCECGSFARYDDFTKCSECHFKRAVSA
jgi:hypothetical protein